MPDSAKSEGGAQLDEDRAIRSLFPPEVAVCVATPTIRSLPLLPAERSFVQNAVEKRRHEFQAGRACARVALQELGVPAAAIPVGPDRAPVWPAGVLGSITHTRDFCAAAVARSRDLAGLGIDAEPRGRVKPKLQSHICTEAELAWMQTALPSGSAPVSDWRTLVFSAKESLYKALHRSLGGARLGFKDATVPRAPDDGRFWIEVRAERRPAGVPILLEGRYVLTESHVITGLVLGAG